MYPYFVVYPCFVLCILVLFYASLFCFMYPCFVEIICFLVEQSIILSYYRKNRNKCFINFAWPNITLFINLMSTENMKKQLRIAKNHLYCF